MKTVAATISVTMGSRNRPEDSWAASVARASASWSAEWKKIAERKQDLGYEPLVSLDDGMRRLKAWFEEQDGDLT